MLLRKCVILKISLKYILHNLSAVLTTRVLTTRVLTTRVLTTRVLTTCILTRF